MDIFVNGDVNNTYLRMLNVDFSRLRVDRRPKRIKSYAFTNVNVYVWTGHNVICDDPDEHKLLFCRHVSKVWREGSWRAVSYGFRVHNL